MSLSDHSRRHPPQPSSPLCPASAPRTAHPGEAHPRPTRHRVPPTTRVAPMALPIPRRRTDGAGWRRRSGSGREVGGAAAAARALRRGVQERECGRIEAQATCGDTQRHRPVRPERREISVEGGGPRGGKSHHSRMAGTHAGSTLRIHQGGPAMPAFEYSWTRGNLCMGRADAPTGMSCSGCDLGPQRSYEDLEIPCLAQEDEA